MILRLRSQMQKPWFKAVIWSSLLAMMLLTVVAELSRKLSGGGSAYVVRVGRTSIDQQEFATAVQKKLLLLRLRMGSYADMILQQLTPRMLGELVAQDILLQNVASALGIYIDEEYAKTRMPQDLPVGSQNLIADAIEQEIAHELVIACAAANVVVPSWLVTSALNAQFAQRRCIVVSMTRSVVEGTLKSNGIADAELATFFAIKNKETKAYWTAPRRTALLYTFNPATYGIVISDKELSSLYNKVKYQRFVATPAELQLRQIQLVGDLPGATTRYADAVQLAQQLQKNPTTFAAVAAEKSGAPVELGFVTKEKLPKAVADVAFALANDGDISHVIRAEDNKYVIVQRVAKKAATYKPLAAVAETLNKELIAQKFAQQLATDVKRATLGSTKKELLALFATKHHGVESSLQSVTNDDSALHRLLFATRLNTVGATVIDGKGYALVVTEVKPSVQPAFATVKERVLQDFLKEQALQRIEKSLQTMAIEPGSLADKAKNANITTMTTPLLAPSDKGQLEELQKKIGKAAAEKCVSLNVIGQTALIMSDEGGYLIQAMEIVPPSQKLIDEHRAATELQLFQDERRLAEGAFVEKLAKDAKIEYNNDLIS